MATRKVQKKKPLTLMQKLARNQKSLLVAAFFIIFGAVGVKMLFFSQATTFQTLGTHPQAVTQPPSTGGKNISGLGSFNGKIYAGYGDYNANTGPIALTPLDPATGTFTSTPEYMADTEMVSIFRTINGRVYIPSIDPRVSSDYTMGEIVGGKTVWTSHKVGMVHVFDIVTLSGTDLWMIGSATAADGTDHGQVWYSGDGGANWSLSLDTPPQTAGNNVLRFTFAAPLGGKLYVQGYEYSTSATSMSGQVDYSWVFDGARWSKVGASSYANLSNAQVFNGKVLMSGMGLMTFDGKTASTLVRNALSYSIGPDGYVYTLVFNNADGTASVQRSNDLVSWQNVTAAPKTARTILVDDHYIYLGAGEAEIYRADLNLHDSDTTPPTVAVVLPAGGATISGATRLQASASDAAGITKVEFYAGTILIGTARQNNVDGSGPYYQSGWDGYGVPNGPVAITAVAYDTYGNSATSAPVNVTINTPVPTDTTGPQITITNPTPTTRIGKTIAIYSTAQDPSYIKNGTVALDGTVLQSYTWGNVSPASMNVRTPNLTRGYHTITVTATDRYGNQNSVNYTFKK